MAGVVHLLFKGERVQSYEYKDNSEKNEKIEKWRRLYGKGFINWCEIEDIQGGEKNQKLKYMTYKDAANRLRDNRIIFNEVIRDGEVSSIRVDCSPLLMDELADAIREILPVMRVDTMKNSSYILITQKPLEQ